VSAAFMLFVIACVVAVLSFSLAGVIWAGQPVMTAGAECGTLRAPLEPMLLSQSAVTTDPSLRIEAALAPERCSQARSTALFGFRMSLMAGTAASATAVGALIAEQRDKRHHAAEVAAGRERVNGLDGHGMPGRRPMIIDVQGADSGWDTTNQTP